MIKNIIKKWFFQPYIPIHLKSRFRRLDESEITKLQESLKTNFYKDSPPDFLASESGKRDLSDHMFDTLKLNRHYIIPWLDSIKKLEGSKILEIGCGTGATTIALAEQGAIVTGLDIDEPSLKEAKDRCDIYKIDATILKSNAMDIRSLFSRGDFDFIIFYASLEHMTHQERMIALADAWSLLPKDGILGVIETPNRLWYFDSHTSGLPFYLWLSDDMAIEYSRFSARKTFNDLNNLSGELSYAELMRWGRGVSFHEFELAIEGVNLNSRVSCSADFVRKQRLASRLKWRFSKEHQFEKFIHSLRLDIHSGFFQPYLNISITKS